jgi:hypothetical protein
MNAYLSLENYQNSKKIYKSQGVELVGMNLSDPYHTANRSHPFELHLEKYQH